MKNLNPLRTIALLLLLLLSLADGYFAQDRPKKPLNSKELRESRKAQKEAEKMLRNIEIAMMQERILDYHADIRVDTLSKLTVTETILVNAKGRLIQRGIYRMLPLKRDVNNKVISVKYDILSIKKNGVEEDFHTKSESGYYYIYIGNEDIFLSQGIYEYEITYDTYNQIGYFDGFDELYWNVCGNNWSFDIDTVTATVHLPAGAEILQNACYTGYMGSTEKNCTSYTDSSNTIYWRAEELKMNEGLTIGVGFTKGIVNPPPLPFYLQPKNLLQLLLAVGAFILLYMIFFWYRHGIDPKAPTVIPQFDAPAHLSPADMGYLTNRRYRSNLLTASIINLATKGHIRIIENKKEGLLKRSTFTLRKLQGGSGSISPQESNLLNSFFSHRNSEVKLDGQYDPTVADAIIRFQKSVSNINKDLVVHGNNRKKTILPILLVSAVFAALMIAGNIYLFDTDKMAWGFVLLGVHLVLFLIYISAKTHYKRLAKWFWIVPLGITFFLYKSFDAEELKTDLFAMGYIFISIGFTLITIFSYLIEQPSKDLLRLLSDIEGFKMYLSAAESKLIQFFNPPKITPEVFEKYLPYAMVLGVDEIWGKKFEAALKEQAVQYQNKWYSGSDMNNFERGIGRSLSSGLHSSMAAASTVPGSSSSGSSGGGSSGGGGGGGGGGGW